MLKYFAAAAALVASTGAAAQAPNTVSQPTKVRHAVLENIISRVQMDALISKVVASDIPVARTAPVSSRRAVVYAASAPVSVR